jgi:hypothetical protein
MFSAFFKDSSMMGQNCQGPIFLALPAGWYAIAEGASRVPQIRVSLGALKIWVSEIAFPAF